MYLRVISRLLFIFSLITLWSPTANAIWEFNMTPGVTEVSQSVYQLHMTILWICVAIGIAVFGVMFYALINHRKSKGVKPADFHESTKVELLWTIIPFLILIVMAYPATKTLLNMSDTSNPDIEIMVTGYQWKWHYEYLNEPSYNNDKGESINVNFFSNLRTPEEEINNEIEKGEHYLLEVDEPIVVPINKKIRFMYTANDVIHSWWIPAFAVKKDAVPGIINESWTKINKPGIYRGQCTELCGKDHGFMPIVVHATTEEEYQAWLAEKKEKAKQVYNTIGKEWTLEDLMARGEEVYNTACAACHQKDGQGIDGSFPGLAGSAIATGDKAKHIDVVINGVPGTYMNAFAGQLNAADMAAVITYERNAWGNDTNDLIQPSEINEIMQNAQ